jgi:hypothetical protein
MPDGSKVTAATVQPDTDSLVRINKAGRSLAALRTAAIDHEVDLDAITDEEWAPISKEVELLEGWRERHAGPLRNTTRTYATTFARTLSGLTGRVSHAAAQEVLDHPRQLSRYPTMRLTAMEDIGGARAILPTQAAADDVARRLRKNWKVHRYRDYDIRAAKATVTEFDDYDAALAAYESIEKQNLGRNDLDIVLLGADSLETIEKTHSSYFMTTEGGFEQFLGDLLTNV